MKKLTLSTIALLVAGASITTANAADKTNFYSNVKLAADLTKVKDSSNDDLDITKTKATFGYSVAGGYNFNSAFNLPVRAELEVGYQTPWKNTGEDIEYKSKSLTVMVNGYYDFATGTPFTPFVTLGLGWAHTKFDASDESTSFNKFAYSAGFGSAYTINSDLSVDLSYRFLDAGKEGDVKVFHHNIGAGLTYNF